MYSLCSDQICALRYSTTGDAILVAAGNAQVCTVVADYFACQKFRSLATKRDTYTQIFHGGKFSLITSAKKKSARNNSLLTCAIMLMELCIHVRVATTSTAKQLPGKSYCVSVSPGTRRTVTVMPSASCGNMFRGFNIRGLSSSANTVKISPPRN